MACCKQLLQQQLISESSAACSRLSVICEELLTASVNVSKTELSVQQCSSVTALNCSQIPLAVSATVATTGVGPRPLAVSVTVHIVTLISFEDAS